jgi:hypothetical protein
MKNSETSAGVAHFQRFIFRTKAYRRQIKRLRGGCQNDRNNLKAQELSTVFL